MRILLTSNYYPEHPGGIESVTATLAVGYRALGHQVRWAAADVAGAPRAAGPDDRPLPASNFTEQRLGFPYPLPSARALRRLRADVEWADAVHLNDSLYAVSQACYRHARSVRRPVLLTQHVPPVRYPNPALRALQAAAYATLGHRLIEGADQVAFVSETVARAYSRLHFRRPPAVVENAIDTSIFTPGTDADRSAARKAAGLACDRPVLLFAGRFVHKKGLGRLREVARALPAVQVVMVGRADDVDPATWGAANVTVLSPVPQRQLRDLYIAADLLFLVSEGEGFPVSVQEAMASGTPALVSRATGAALPGLDRLLFTADDDVVAATQRALAAAPALRAAVADAARARWTRDAMAAAYADLLRAICS